MAPYTKAGDTDTDRSNDYVQTNVKELDSPSQ